jgi:hypothetical protein
VLAQAEALELVLDPVLDLAEAEVLEGSVLVLALALDLAAVPEVELDSDHNHPE